MGIPNRSTGIPLVLEKKEKKLSVNSLEISNRHHNPYVKKQPVCYASTLLILIYSTRKKKFLDLSSSSFLCLLNSVSTMEFHGGDRQSTSMERRGRISWIILCSDNGQELSGRGRHVKASDRDTPQAQR